ncbi:phosphomethylpyrimidine kinase / phosphomethylpyrimidine phosphate kinase / thiamine-phosphate synthase [Natronomonas moolapensis 8.8.11]|uniref:Phosphomethylpyrimidine kinase / phosphomethylpyrimidine phosphate kinase / thiamine-phosphate synthase n=1 Tax=Natronomonas moolapensis (strain DSM 18674 / CECT 7526 / JCM 14361 / 8.8.11) TaxID=268739 RepID=M1XU53_NATM8|nr:bifunctional hydroxymethylpyrimidine kinase/phosphomethylpyrimidine kinase [Natronomonas moolapensis]CCQ37996.1 phosphomethylpyrimidine kinase / phosphomethylpyrimidine phosphate kinase / thiamine-phosphate synthase [Natronomonas moolapensis 8.8.11]
MSDMRAAAPMEKPVVLTVAGSDSGGGAGIQADLKTIEATGGFGVSAITAITAQNTTGVESSHPLPIAEITAQIDAVREDFDVRAVKTGMLATAEVVETVADYAAGVDAPVVVDPVMVATSGDRLLTEAAETAYEDLLAEAALATPNADEAAVLTGIEPTDEASAMAAGRELRSMGAEAALIKGGHVPGAAVLDVLVGPDGAETMRHPRIDTEATHGSGCTLSATIATRLARGVPLETAVERGVSFMERAVRYHHAAGTGPGAVHHLVDLRNEAGRAEATETVREAIDRLAEGGGDGSGSAASAIDNVASATPYAETDRDVAAVEGGWPPGADSAAPGRIRFGAAPALGAALLDGRERDPDLRVALACRPDVDLEDALDASPCVVADVDGGGIAVLSEDIDAALEAVETAHSA